MGGPRRRSTAPGSTSRGSAAPWRTACTGRRWPSVAAWSWSDGPSCAEPAPPEESSDAGECWTSTADRSGAAGSGRRTCSPRRRPSSPGRPPTRAAAPTVARSTTVARPTTGARPTTVARPTIATHRVRTRRGLCCWSAPTDGTTSAVPSAGGRSRWLWPTGGPTRRGSAPTSAATGSPRTCSSSRTARSTAVSTPPRRQRSCPGTSTGWWTWITSEGSPPTRRRSRWRSRRSCAPMARVPSPTCVPATWPHPDADRWHVEVHGAGALPARSRVTVQRTRQPAARLTCRAESDSSAFGWTATLDAPGP